MAGTLSFEQGESKMIMTALQLTMQKAHLSNNDIGDLHGGNLGYIEGQPIIVDYSGYWE